MILVTGGSGFIGSAITKYLVENKKKVIVFDKIPEEVKSFKRVKDKIHFIKGDIRNKKIIIYKS